MVRNFLLATLLTGVVSTLSNANSDNLTSSEKSEISSSLKSICIRSLSKVSAIQDFTIDQSAVESFGWFGEPVSVPFRDGITRIGDSSNAKFIGLADFGKTALFEIQEIVAAAYTSESSTKKTKTIRIATAELNLDQMVLSQPTLIVTYKIPGTDGTNGSEVTVQGVVKSVLRRFSDGSRRNIITISAEDGKKIIYEDTILKVDVVGGSLVRFRAKGEGEVVRGYVIAETGNRLLRVATSDAKGGISIKNYSFYDIDPATFVVENSPVKLPNQDAPKPRFVVASKGEDNAPLVGGYSKKIEGLFAGSAFAIRVPQKSTKALWRIEDLDIETARSFEIPIDNHSEVELGASSGSSMVSELNNRVFSNESPWRMESGYYNFVITEQSDIRFGLVRKKDSSDYPIAFGLSPLHLSKGVGVLAAGQVLVDHDRPKIVFNLKDNVFMRDLIANNRIDVRATIRKVIELFQIMAPGIRVEFSGWLEGAEDGWYVDRMVDLFPPELKIIGKEELRILLTWSSFRQHNPLTVAGFVNYLRARRR